MANITIRVKLDTTFTTGLPCTCEEELWDALADSHKLDEKFIEACIDAATIDSADYDEPENPNDEYDPERDAD